MKMTKKQIMLIGIITGLLLIVTIGIFVTYNYIESGSLLGGTSAKSKYMSQAYTLSQEFESVEDMVSTNPSGAGLDTSYYEVKGVKYFFDPENGAYIDEGTFCMSSLSNGVVPVVGELKDLKEDGTLKAGAYSYNGKVYYWNTDKMKWGEVNPVKNSNGMLSLDGYENNISTDFVPATLEEDSESSTDGGEIEDIVEDGNSNEIINSGIDSGEIIPSETTEGTTQPTVDDAALYSYINGGATGTQGTSQTNSYTPSPSYNTQGTAGATGPQGPQGPKGATGTPGVTGKSAYEIAKSAGYRGTEKEWISSLAGQSAFQLAQKYGYAGTEKDWVSTLKAQSLYETAKAGGYKGTESDFLKSLTGKNGVDGLTAYQIAVKGGYKGSEAEWIATLSGKSAYQAAKDSGFNGTETQWVASLKGASIYDIAVRSGFKGTEADFIKTLRGLSAYELAVNNGYTGTETQWLNTLKSQSTDVTVNNIPQTPNTKNIQLTAADILTADQLKILQAFSGFEVDLTGMNAGDVLTYKDGKIVPISKVDLGIISDGTTPELGTAVLSKTNPGAGWVCVNTTSVMNDTTPLYGVVLVSGPNAAALKASSWFVDSTITAAGGAIVPCFKFIYTVAPGDASKFYIYVGTVSTVGDKTVAPDGTLS